MYHEFRNVGRTEWKYAYKGGDLASFAEARLAHHRDAEIAARETCQSLFKDRSVSMSDARVVKAQSDAATNGSIREQLEIWVHEFRRTPDREFNLALGDVVFFGVAGHEPGASADD